MKSQIIYCAGNWIQSGITMYSANNLGRRIQSRVLNLAWSKSHRYYQNVKAELDSYPYPSVLLQNFIIFFKEKTLVIIIWTVYFQVFISHYVAFNFLQAHIFLNFCFRKLTSPGNVLWQTKSKLSHTEKHVFLPRRKVRSCCVCPQASIKIHRLSSATLIRNFKQTWSAKRKLFWFQAH